MSKEFFYIYCRGILGVKSNVRRFRWLYGSVAPCSVAEEYENCTVKIDICVKHEKDLGSVQHYDKRFQSYVWDSQTKTISCRRTFLRNINIGFNLRIDGNTIYAEIGSHYYKYVRNRIMNLHSIYYLLADLANIMMLRNGFLSLYASAVYNELLNKGIVCFAPPNTGKTVTATKLCEFPGYKFVGEDVVITDGERVYSCPWTCSYRKSSKDKDNAGSLGRVNKIDTVRNTHEKCDLTDLVVLSLGKVETSTDKKEIYDQICILNGYLFGYYSTPIVKILSYFDEEFRKPWDEHSAEMLKNIVQSCNCHLIQAETSMEFYKWIYFKETAKKV